MGYAPSLHCMNDIHDFALKTQFLRNTFEIAKDIVNFIHNTAILDELLR